jgi:hypothetical protein
MKPVTRGEFEQFVVSYPRQLERDVARFCEPPVVTYNDFSLGNWPASVVASHSFETRDSLVPSGWKVKEQS